MGYRSDVALALTKEGVEKLHVAIANVGQEILEELIELFTNPDKHLGDSETGAELWSWKDVKWYADYADVAFVENFIFNEADPNNYHFIRICEEWDDIEVEGDFLDNPFDLHLIRDIDFEDNSTASERHFR